MNIVKMMFIKVLGEVYFYSKRLAPCSTEWLQSAETSSPTFDKSKALVCSYLKLKGDELCDDTSNIPIRRNHAYTDGAEVQSATSSSAEYPSNEARCVPLISAQENIARLRRMRPDVVPTPKRPSLLFEPMKRDVRIQEIDLLQMPEIHVLEQAD